jgi:aspartyl-tRNA(Asn)/glutamyl-tRNA(Gln) amidotransferase subunit A
MSTPETRAGSAPASFSPRLASALGAFVRRPVHAGAPSGPLAGWSVALKDNIDVAGDTVEIGSRVFRGRRATSTATVAQRLADAGATLDGRTQLVELCFGSYGLNDYSGTALNPWDARVERAPGGSSSGSAVAVAARLVRAALGSDTAGSIRMPAALCGITGFKPTFGRVPLDGVFPLAHGYDSVGPMAVDAEDCAALMGVIAADPTLHVGPARRGRVAVLPERLWPMEAAAAVREAAARAADVFASLGFETEHVCAAPDFAALTKQAGTLIAAGAWQILKPYFESREEAFGPALRDRMHLARQLDPGDIADATAARALATQSFESWARGFDVLLMPTVGATAPVLAEVREHASTLGHFTRWVNHVGGCAISLPAGFDANGLPVGIQLVGRSGGDATVLGIAQAFQEATDWHRREPDLAAWHASARGDQPVSN